MSGSSNLDDGSCSELERLKRAYFEAEARNAPPSCHADTIPFTHTVLQTGTATPFITNLNGPHGLGFAPDFNSLFGK